MVALGPGYAAPGFDAGHAVESGDNGVAVNRSDPEAAAASPGCPERVMSGAFGRRPSSYDVRYASDSDRIAALLQSAVFGPKAEGSTLKEIWSASTPLHTWRDDKARGLPCGRV